MDVKIFGRVALVFLVSHPGRSIVDGALVRRVRSIVLRAFFSCRGVVERLMTRMRVSLVLEVGTVFVGSLNGQQLVFLLLLLWSA